MKDPWRKTRREKLAAFAETTVVVVGIGICAATFGWLMTYKADEIRTNMCAQAGMRMTNVRTWGDVICVDKAGALFKVRVRD